MAKAEDQLQPGVRDITIVEVGPRDGLQNEPGIVPTPVKIAFIDALAAAGLPVVEATSFVNPKRVPQMADAAEVLSGIHRIPGVRFPVLVPNTRGLDRAIESGADAIALFAAATEAFSEANVGATIDATFERIVPVATAASERGMWIRGYVSVAFGCPYSGDVAPGAVVDVTERLLELGCREICLADTIGAGTPADTRRLLRAILPIVPAQAVALHFHDTSGSALDNVEEALSHGVRVFDAAAAGLGGCPFAPGAPGNLATERLLRRFDQLGLRTGVSHAQLAEAVSLLTPYVPRVQRLPA